MNTYNVTIHTPDRAKLIKKQACFSDRDDALAYARGYASEYDVLVYDRVAMRAVELEAA